MMRGCNNGKIGKFTCNNCGFTDYVTDEQWCSGNSGTSKSCGVWAFKWWNGTDKGLYCICPGCHQKMFKWKLESAHYGMAVVWSEEIMSS